MRQTSAAVALLAAVVLSGCASAAAAGPQEVTISFRYSRFMPATISVPAGVPVTFTLRNDDPLMSDRIVVPECDGDTHASRHLHG